jgi:hypothetical protein
MSQELGRRDPSERGTHDPEEARQVFHRQPNRRRAAGA